VKRKKHHTYKIRTFLLFLFVACIIWVLTKFSKEYTATISCPLSYSNLPENYILGKGSPDNVTFDVTANGFEFLQYSLKTPEIEIDLANYSNKEGEQIVINKSNLSRIITTQLKKDIAIVNVSPSQLAINLDVIIFKKLPIRAITDITFKEGYKSVNNYTLSPDSIIVSWPNNRLDSIQYVTTKPVILEKVDKAVRIAVLLNLPDEGVTFVETEKIYFSMDVVEYTQKTIVLPIEIINLPANTTIKIIPETITVTFDVSVSGFNEVSVNDFRVVCDFSQKNDEENFLIAKLVNQPEEILNVELSDKKIDYLIFK